MITQHHVNLNPYNTFGVDATAEQFATIRSANDLLAAIKQLNHDTPRLVLGGGSNVLLTDDIPGIVLHNQIKGIQLIAESAQSVTLQIGSGHNWHNLVQYAIEHQWYGLENLSLIPGTVGAAPIQNIGAYGVEFSSVLQSLNAINLHSGERRTLFKQDCELGYRDSIFKRQQSNQWMITDVTIVLSKQADLNLSYSALQSHLEQHKIKPSLKSVSEAVIAIRNSKLPDPKDIGNAGSFFKNPIVSQQHLDTLLTRFPTMPHHPFENKQYKIPAAWLIEQAGLKGHRLADAGTHHKQAVVVVNHANATGKDIANFAKKIQQKVFTGFNIRLENEVNILPKSQTQ